MQTQATLGGNFDAGTPAVQTPAPHEAARLAEAKRQQQAAEAARYRERADLAAREAARLWAQASEPNSSAAAGYLVRKGVQAHGVRVLPGGVLLVPMRDAAGQLQNVQRIAPEKPADGGPDKRFLPGGRKSGLWHLVGSTEGAAVLLLAEGYATAASLHEATGRPVAVYVLPSSSIGTAEGRRYVFQSDAGMEDTFRRHGDLAQWQAGVAALAVDNSRLVFALCCAFAGPALRLAGMESGGFHLRGTSSMGKTTALKVAASVWGRPSYMQRWRTTDNALEATAVQHCDGLLILDEFGQLDPRVAGECAYMLANDQEKGRATRGDLSRKRRTWRLLFLSSGEVSLADHMAEAGKRTQAGMEVRMVDVPLDAGAGMGGLECTHGLDGPAALADAITAAAARHYGTAGQAWLEWCCEHHAGLPERLQELTDRYRADLVPEAASEQVRRVGSRFALVAAAGELAGEAGITAWQAGHAAWGVRECFNAWLAARGHLDNGEEAAMLRQARAWFEKNADALLTWTHRGMDDHKPSTPLRAGFKRMLDAQGNPIKFHAATEYLNKGPTGQIDNTEQRNGLAEFLVLPEAFKCDVCKGFDAAAVARVLKKRGHLVHQAGRLTDKQRLPGIGPVPVYHVKPSTFADELGEQ